MFSNKENESASSENIGADSYFHTMKEDLKNPFKKTGYQAPLQAPEQPLGRNDERFPTSEKNTPASASPFLSGTEFAEPKAVPTEEAATNKTPLASLAATLPTSPEKDPVANIVSAEKKSNPLLTIAIVALLLCILAVGGYFFWMTRVPAETETMPEQKENTTPPATENEGSGENKPVVINPELEKYSTENPNILSIDIETISTQDIKDLLKKKADDLANLQIKKPVEFIITDKNNTPVAFPIFAVTSKITLSQDLLSNLEEKFSLYIYPESFGSRLGLAIKTKNGDAVLTKMLAQEKTLVSDLDLLFLDNKPTAPANRLYKDSKYNGFNIRYLNLNQDASYSVDYTINNSQLLIGTSKSTLRAIIDHISTTNKSPQE